MLAARDRDPAARGVAPGEILATWPGIHALLAYRLAHALQEADVPLLPRSMSMFTRALTGIEIHPAARIGQGLFIDHGAGVVIGETAEIGDDVTLYQGVTLGGTGFATGKRHPTVAGQRDDRLGCEAAGADHDRPWSQDRCEQRGDHRRAAQLDRRRQPGHPVRVDGRRIEGPDADWIHLPDPIAEAIQGLASRIGALERMVSELSDERSPSRSAEVRPLRTVKGPNPAGG